jgi:hypothetical protein
MKTLICTTLSLVSLTIFTAQSHDANANDSVRLNDNAQTLKQALNNIKARPLVSFVLPVIQHPIPTPVIRPTHVPVSVLFDDVAITHDLNALLSTQVTENLRNMHVKVGASGKSLATRAD